MGSGSLRKSGIIYVKRWSRYEEKRAQKQKQKQTHKAERRTQNAEGTSYSERTHALCGLEKVQGVYLWEMRLERFELGWYVYVGCAARTEPGK